MQSTATTVGVLLALGRHDAQIAALRQAEDERLAAQARRIVPAIFRGNIFSNTLWNVRIDNASTDTVSFIEIDIIIRDRNANEVSHGYRLAQRDTVAQTMINVLLPKFSQVMDAMAARLNEFFESARSRVLTLTDDPE